jgi:hypothetical protein
MVPLDRIEPSFGRIPAHQDHPRIAMAILRQNWIAFTTEIYTQVPGQGNQGRTLAANRLARPCGWPPPDGRRILRGVLARVRKWFDGAGWFVGAAVVLLIVALLAVLAGLQSQDSVLWTGQQVTGTEQRGLVYYRWQGQSYSLAVPGFGSSKAVSVYFNPGDPSQAMVDNVADRVLAGLLVLGPAAGAVVLLVIGGTRNYRWQRRKLKRAREFRL